MDITLGLDFGTHQTKLCLSYMPNNDTIHEFVEFNTPDGEVTTLFPSVIQINDDDTIGVGFVDENRCKGISTPRPIMPALPKEPERKLPPKPEKIYPEEPPMVPLGLIEKILSLAKGTDKNKIAHQQWIKDCAKIDSEYERDTDSWEKECAAITAGYDSWVQEVAMIKTGYKKDVAEWEKENSDREYYRYFKLSSFSDAYPWNPEHIIDADTLSIWYLTYLMLYVKQLVKRKFEEQFEESIAIQMGVPSGINTQFSQKIKFKAFKVLIAARQLMDNFNSHEELCQIKYQDLIKMTKIPTSDITTTAESYGFFVMPEAFAGLQSLTNRKRLTRGRMHLLVDIGGGTTDIAFFTINEDLSPDVHTVMSFHKGLNYVFDVFCQENKGYSIYDAQELFRVDRSKFSKGLSAYRKELSAQLENLINHIKNQFLVHTSSARLSVDTLTEAMRGCPIVYCGGGSVYKQMRVNTMFFTDQRLIDKNTLNIPNLINRHISDDLYPILATSYGLSIPQFEEPVMKDLSELFGIIVKNVMGGKTDSDPKFEYGITDD